MVWLWPCLVIEDNALAIFADYQMPVRLRGVPDGYNRINGLDSVIVDGEFKLHDQVSRYAVLGAGPAIKLHARRASCAWYSSMPRSAKGV